MKNDSINQLEFKPLKSKKVFVCFDEPQVSSDARVMLLREVEKAFAGKNTTASGLSERCYCSSHSMHCDTSELSTTTLVDSGTCTRAI